MLRDVNISLTDGGLSNGPTGDGVHVKIGASPKAVTAPILVKSSWTVAKIREQLGYSPLADAAMDSLENGAASIYCLPVSPSASGTVGEVTKVGTGTGELSVTGQPNNGYEVQVEITQDGKYNEAGLRYSLDGGNTYTDPVTMPLDGQFAILPTGLNLTFTEGESGFKAGDRFTFVTTAPSMDAAGILAALEQLRTWRTPFEFIHIVGSVSKAVQVAVSTALEEMADKDHKPLIAVCETALTAGQSASEFVQTLQADGINAKRLVVVSAAGVYRRMDGTTQAVNLAGVVCGLLAQANPQQSIGEVRAFPISADKLLGLLPSGIESYLDELDDAGYLTIRQYDGLTDYYVNNARTMAPGDSDYRYIERIRVSNKISCQVRAQLLQQLQVQVDLNKVDAELKAIGAFAAIPLDRMMESSPAQISSYRIVIPEGQDILTSETLELMIYYVPVGHIREINVAIGMENPYKQ